MLKGTFGNWCYFCRGDHAYKYGSKNTLLTSDFQLHGNLSFPLMPLSVLPKEGQYTQGHTMDDIGVLYHGLCLAVRLKVTIPRLLSPELLFIMTPHCRDTPIFSAQVALHVVRLSPSTANSGGHGQKQSEMNSCANQRGFSAATSLNTPLNFAFIFY